MEGTRPLKYCISIIIFLIIFRTIRQAESVMYTVGDEDRWSTGVNYFAWSQKYNFSVGDFLVFDYVKGQHNAYEVTKGTYQSCNSSIGVLKMYDSGNDQVRLTEARQYWFICDIPDHCSGGMKFGVVVKEGVATNPDSQSVPPSDANGSTAQGRGQAWEYLLALAILLLMI